MAESAPQAAPPSGGGKPPAPPSAGGPGRGVPDPFDHGPPIAVLVDGEPFGDLGNARVDALLLSAIVHGGSEVAEWLVAFGAAPRIDVDERLVDAQVALDRLALGRIGRGDRACHPRADRASSAVTDPTPERLLQRPATSVPEAPRTSRVR